MNNASQKKQGNGGSSLGSIVAGVAGAVAVAGVAVAATIALRDKKTREKAKRVLADIKDQTLDFAESLKKDLNTKKIPQKTKKIINKNISVQQVKRAKREVK